MPKVHLPAALREGAGGSPVEVPGDTVGEVLEALATQYPSLRARLFDPSGATHRYLGLFVAGAQVRGEGALRRPLTPEDELTVLVAVAGG